MLVMCFQVTVSHLIISVLFLLLVLGGIIGLLLKPHFEEGGKYSNNVFLWRLMSPSQVQVQVSTSTSSLLSKNNSF